MDLPTIISPVTYLEMVARPESRGVVLADRYELRHMRQPDVDFYLNLYRVVGRDYIWNYRPGQTRAEVEAIIHSYNTELHVLYEDGQAIGLAELDVTASNDVEIVHFGLIPERTNKDIGRNFLACLLERLWERPLTRIMLSTCGLDHAKAIRFYQAAGFKIFEMKIGTFKDYRLSEFYHPSDAPDIPLGVAFYNRQTTC